MFVVLSIKTKNINLLYSYLSFLFFKFDNSVLVLKQFKKKKNKKVTVLKSPHVNKKAKESFEYCIYVVEMLLYVVNLNTLIFKFIKLKNNIFLDLIIIVKLLYLDLKKLRNLNYFLLKKSIKNSKFLKLLDIIGEINLNI
jgi:hypothetical protein